MTESGVVFAVCCSGERDTHTTTYPSAVFRRPSSRTGELRFFAPATTDDAIQSLIEEDERKERQHETGRDSRACRRQAD